MSRRVDIRQRMIDDLAERMLARRQLEEHGAPAAQISFAERAVIVASRRLGPRFAVHAEARSLDLERMQAAQDERERQAQERCEMCLHFVDADAPEAGPWCPLHETSLPGDGRPCSDWKMRH